MVKLGRIALDGIKVGASGSKHKATSYGLIKHNQRGRDTNRPAYSLKSLEAWAGSPVDLAVVPQQFMLSIIRAMGNA